LRPDEEVQAQAIASLAGLDAVESKGFKDFGVYSVAFDSTGKRLLMAISDRQGKPIGARLWGDDTQRLDDPGATYEGPVGFRPDGAPIQLAADDKQGTLRLMELTKREAIHRFEIPGTLAVR